MPAAHSVAPTQGEALLASALGPGLAPQICIWAPALQCRLRWAQRPRGKTWPLPLQPLSSLLPSMTPGVESAAFTRGMRVDEAVLLFQVQH